MGLYYEMTKHSVLTSISHRACLIVSLCQNPSTYAPDENVNIITGVWICILDLVQCRSSHEQRSRSPHSGLSCRYRRSGSLAALHVTGGREIVVGSEHLQ